MLGLAATLEYVAVFIFLSFSFFFLVFGGGEKKLDFKEFCIMKKRRINYVISIYNFQWVAKNVIHTIDHF